MRINKVLKVKKHTELLMKGIPAVVYTTVERMLATMRSAILANELLEDFDKGPLIYVRNFKGYSIAIFPDHVHVFRWRGETTEEEATKVVEELEKLLARQKPGN